MKKPTGVSSLFAAWRLLCAASLLAAFNASSATTILISSNAAWRYLVTSADPGTAWRQPGYNDSAWPQGPAQLGFGDSDEATVLFDMMSSLSNNITAYFRRPFVVTNAALITNLNLRLLRDDGAAVYLNGTEVRRDNLPAGELTHFTFSNAAVGGADESTFFSTTVPVGVLATGTNTVAVEVHQNAVTSGDLSFALELIAQTGTSTNIPPSSNFPPVVRLASPTNGASFAAPTNLLLVATAYDPGTNGRVLWLEFYADTNRLGTVTNMYSGVLGTNFFFEWMNAPTGTHVLTVRARDNQGATGMSPPVTISVSPGGPSLVMGYLRWEVYTNIPGLTVADLTNHPSFPDQPAFSNLLSQFETPEQVDDNFGARISGFLLPPVTGEYVFYLSSDDQGVLFLSSDESPANKMQIAWEPTWSPVRQWVGTGAGRTNNENISPPIHLESGRRYYVEALYKEGGGGDHLGVAWQMPGDLVPEIGSPPIPGAYLATYGVVPTNPLPTVTVTAVGAAWATEPIRTSTNSTSGQLGLLRLSRSGNPAQPLAVNIQMSGSALNGVDYLPINSPVVFPAGTNAVTIFVEPVFDALIETDETAVLTIVPDAGYTVSQPSQATITIADSTYAARQINVVASDSQAAETAAGMLSNVAAFTFTLSGDTNRWTTVDYRLSGTASNGVDYLPLPGTVSFPPGVRVVTEVIQPIDDLLNEGTETVTLTIPSPPCLGFGPPPWCYEVGPSNQATAFIADNESASNRPPVVAIMWPANGAQFTLPTNLTITAQVSDVDGYVTQVEFFAGTNRLGLVTQLDTLVGLEGPIPLPPNQPPFRFTWTNPPPGAHVLRAVATDNRGATASSPPVEIVVGAGLTLALALDAPELIWTTGGDAPWIPQTAITHDGVDAAQSTVPMLEMQTWLATTVNGPGTVSFQWRILGYAGYDHLSFFIGSNQVGRITTTAEPPAEASWQAATFAVPPGLHALRWVHDVPSEPIVNYSGAWLDEVRFVASTQFPPSVVITQPTNGAQFILPTNVTITAHASAAEGYYVTQVEFFAGTNRLGLVTQLDTLAGLEGPIPLPPNQPPFRFTWTSPPPGAHVLRAVATDNRGATASSPPVEIVVGAGLTLALALDAPELIWTTGGDAPWIPQTAITHDGVDAAQSTVPMLEMQTWLATTVNGPGTVSFQWRILGYAGYDHLSFFIGSNQVGRITTAAEPPADAPWQAATFAVPPGLHALRWVYDVPSEPIVNYSGAWLDEVRFVPFSPPSVAITQPTNAAVATLPTNLAITVEVGSQNGLVTQIEIFDGTNRIGLRQLFPQPAPPAQWALGFAWTNPPPGSHTLRAVATDNDGLRGTSAPVTITVRANYEFPTNFPFQLAFYSGDGYSPGGSIYFRDYTLLGPSSGATSRLLPGLRAIADRVGTPGSYDNRHFYTVLPQSILKIDFLTGAAQEMQLDPGLPELSWTMGATFDHSRNRVVLVTLGGEGYLYAYSPAQDRWSLMASAQNWDCDSLVYHGARDEFYGLEVHRGVGPGLLHRLSATGAFLGDIPLPALPFDVGVASHRSELISVGDYLVLLIGRDPRFAHDPGPLETRIYLIDPRSKQVWLTYRAFEPMTNQPPSIQVVSPAEGSVFYPTNIIRLSAAAADRDGLVRAVEFFANGQSLGLAHRSTTDPYDETSFVLDWTTAPPGSYTITARATDNESVPTDSAAVHITVRSGTVSVLTLRFDPASLPGGSKLIPSWAEQDFVFTTPAGLGHTDSGSATFYADNGSAFLDSMVGERPLVFSNRLGAPFALLSVDLAEYSTVFASPKDIPFQGYRADGTIVTQVCRLDGIIDGTGLAADFQTFSFDPQFSDLLYVEVPVELYSLDNVRVSLPMANQPPSVAIVSPTNGTVLTQGESITIQAVASDPDGSIARVDFFNFRGGTNLLGNVTAPPYRLTLTNLAGGTYGVAAQAIDDRGGTAFSSAVSIRVSYLPNVTLESPTNGAIYPVGNPVLISVRSGLADGYICSLKIFANTNLLETVNNPPSLHAFWWRNASPGSYSIWARATGCDGRVSTSAPAHITVLPGGLIVTSTADSGPGTLRDIMASAPFGATITFAVTGALALTSGELQITKPLNIVGPGASQLTIQRSTAPGTPDFRIFNVGGGAVKLSGLTIRRGQISATNTYEDGAGILNHGTLVIEECVVIDHTALGEYSRGGAICNQHDATLTVGRSTFARNASSGYYGEGGAIYNYGTLALTNCTFSANSVGMWGGAIHNDMMSGGTVLDSCTFTSNRAQSGGGIFNRGSPPDHVSPVFLRNTIFVGNTGYDIGHCSLIQSGGYNLIGTIGDPYSILALPFVPGPGDRTNVNPAEVRLGPLQDNGGTTPTHALLPGSLALNAGPENGFPPTDQRGVARPFGPRCDIGAFEADGFANTPPMVTCPAPVETQAGSNGLASVNVVVMVTNEDRDDLAVIWTVDGVVALTNRVVGSNLPAAFQILFGRAYAVGQHQVGVSVADGQWPSAWCSTTVNVLSPPPTPPAITQQPISQTRFVGETASFSVIATGAPPLRFQWFKYDVPLFGQTNSTLTLPNVQYTDAGFYQVEVSNFFGLTVSVPASLTVLPSSSTRPGGLDTTFHFTFLDTAEVLASAWDPQGRLVIGGIITTIDGTPQNHVARILTDGIVRVDETFNADPALQNWVRGLAVQADGKVLVGCDFIRGANFTNFGVARLNANGSLDSAFHPPFTPGSYAPTIAVEPSGRIIIGGWLGWQGNVPTFQVLRLLSNGEIGNTSFAAQLNGAPIALLPTPDGKLLIGGDFTSVNGISRPHLVRLNGDGTVDSTFNPGSGTDGAVFCLARQPDGRILIGGAFGSVNGTASGSVARLNTNGSVDVSFHADVAPFAEINAIVVQPDGRIVIGGEADQVGPDVFARGVARLNPDGSTDTTFDPGTGLGGEERTIYTLALQRDGRIILGGQFESYDGIAYGGLVRVFGGAGQAPIITQQPVSLTRSVGQTAVFSVVVTGAPPVSLQWWFRGSPRLGATNASLVVSNVQPDDAGSYFVVAANPFGSVTSAVATLTVTNAPGCVAASPGLVAWWRAENNADDTVGGNAGALFGGLAFSPGRVGQTFRFDGVSYVEVPDAPSLRLTNQLTIEFWVRRDRLDEPHYIVEKGGDWTAGVQNYAVALHTGAYNHCLHFLFAGGWRGGGSIADTNWHHCAVTARNGDTDPVLYVDGAVQPIVYREGASIIQLYPSTRPLHLGAQIDPQSGWFYYHRGQADELSLYNRALSAAEIQAIYRAGSFGKCLTNDLRAPAIVRQPVRLTRSIGQTAVFSVEATGTPPLQFRWRFNNSPIAGATNAALVISNVQPHHAGGYDVAVTNPFGSVTSAVATLTVTSFPTGIPRITSFTPKSATIGTPLTISGTNFGTTGAVNTVYFGAVKATVLTAAVNRLTVSVPPGATYAPISVTVNGRTGWSREPFAPSFPGSGVIDAASFVQMEEDLAAGDGPVHLAVGDLDGDGKPDLAVANRFENTLSIYRSVSTPGVITPQSFAPRFQMPTDLNPTELAAVDLDGDGRLDLVTVNADADTVSIFRNVSLPGSLSAASFAPRLDVPTGRQPVALAVGDLDGDGRPDIVTANHGDNSFTVLWSLASPGNFTSNSFSRRLNYGAGAGPHSIALGDLNNDARLDAVVGNFDANTVSVFPNLPTPGDPLAGFTFGARVDFPAGGRTVTIGDVDGDGGPDIVSGSWTGNTISILRKNIAISSTVISSNSFFPAVTLNTGGYTHNVALGDLDGDGKPDLAVVTEMDSQLLLYHNGTTPGILTASDFSQNIELSAGWNAVGVVLADFDLDGRLDVAFANHYDDSVRIYRNATGTNGVPGSFVRREFPLTFDPSNARFVLLAAAPPASVSAYSVEDQPPAGWAVSAITHGGVFDSRTGKVKFGPFFDADARGLSYRVTPPTGFTGIGVFAGTASADGVDSPITGADRIVIAGPHPADREPALWTMSIAEVTSYAAAWRRGEAWPTPPNPIPTDYVTRAGTLWRSGECYLMDDTITNPPLWWVSCSASNAVAGPAPASAPVVLASSAMRRLPASYIPAEPLPVAIDVTAASDVGAFAVEEHLPPGWAVGRISDGGEWDAANGTVKWGPFFGSAAQRLTYEAVPPSNASGVANFTGRASFDGASVGIGGAQTTRAACRPNFALSTAGGAVRLSLTGEAGQQFLVEASSDLQTWSPLALVTLGAGPTEISDPTAGKFSHRFYRAKPAP